MTVKVMRTLSPKINAQIVQPCQSGLFKLTVFIQPVLPKYQTTYKKDGASFKSEVIGMTAMGRPAGTMLFSKVRNLRQVDGFRCGLCAKGSGTDD